MHLEPNTPILQQSITPFCGPPCTDPIMTAIFRSWTFAPWIIIPLLLSATIYLCGWWQLNRRLPQRFGVWRLIAFQGGLLTLFLALASPLHALAELLLQFHMVQHLLLMMVVPPLLLLGAPILPLLHGLPRSALHYALSHVFASTPLHTKHKIARVANPTPIA